MIYDNFELLDEDYNGKQLIKLTSNEYSGIIYTYGRVNLVEEDDLLRVQFEFDVHENPIGELDRQKFMNHIGQILTELINEQLLKNQVIYTGGIDENRTTDSEQSDS
jgi:hypothetical protein